MTPANETAGDTFGMIFNVGSRRSGTYWLQRIVSAHPDVAQVPSETHLYSHGFATLFERFQHTDPSSAEVGSAYIERQQLLASARELALTSFGEARGRSEPFVAERTPFHVRHIPLIAEIHPEARFIHIIRDGRDVAYSLMKHQWGPQTVTEAAAEWRDSVISGRACGLDPSRYREVRYEKLRTEPESVITELYEWLGLDTGPSALAAALAAASERANLAPGSGGAVGGGRWQQEWSPQDVEAFKGEAGELLLELGYDPGDARPEEPAGRQMAEFWDERARENAYFFINNTLDYRASDPEAFWASGPRDLDALLDALGVAIEPDDEIVEIGCGVGRLTRPLAERGRTVWAFDVSAEMLHEARRENPVLTGVDWIPGDGTSLAPLAAGSADACVSLDVLQHIPDPQVVLGYVAEMGRVLRPGGWSAFQASNDPRPHTPGRGPSLRERVRVRLGRAPAGQQDPAWLGSPIDLGELRRVASEAGLEIERTVGEGTQFCGILVRRL